MKYRISLIVFMLIVVCSFLISGTAMAANSDDLLRAYETGDKEFKRFEIGDRIVYFHQRMIDGAIVEKDFINYQFDENTGGLLDKKVHWRTDLPEYAPISTTKEQAESMAEGEVQFSALYIISPDSDVFPIQPTPENPCWVVRSISDGKLIVTIIDAVTGKFLGYGIPPPYEGFALAGPDWGTTPPCPPFYTAWAKNAETWFETMGYDTEMVDNPTDAKVQSHIQSSQTAMFYELAHGGAYSFHNICPDSESITAGEVETWIAGYTKMPFTFLGSCEGMCDTSDNSLSYEFRKGSSIDTATVGYCHMDADYCADCWPYSIEWQTILFMYMNDPSYTVYAAYNQAMALYPVCQDATHGHCMRFAGDSYLKVKPKVSRGAQHPCCNTGVGGCKDPDIEKAVCAVDTYCCTNYWDSICVSEVESVAGDTCDCCTEHSDATGCYRFDSPDPMAISDCVCAVDPFCCEYYWDLLCASRVESKSCGICYEDCPLPLEPYNPSPANGATNVPLDAILSWNCTLADGFEDGNINEYTILGGTHTVTTASAHDGNYGLESTGSGWMYRNDAAVQAAQGDTISYWVRVRDTNGRAYAGFGATASGTYSIVAAPSSNELLLQLNQGYSFFNIGSSPQTWNNQWYRMEVEWGLNGVIKGRLYDSDGVTLLNTVKAVDNTYNSGGIAFRSFGIAPDYFDTIQICGSSSPAEASINKALKERMAQAPKVPEVPVQSDEDLVWDEENGTYVPADTLKANQKSEVQKTEVPAGYSIKEGMLVEGESKAVVSKPVKQTTPSISASEDPASIVITFDDLNAPCFFAQTVRLTDNYLAYGVTFAGPGGNDGGAIIDECGGFGVSGHSSPNFLAFNTVATLQDGGIPRGPETIYFNPTVSEVKAIVGSQHTGTVTMNAYEGATLVDSATVTLSTTMTPISVSGQNIDKVVVSCTAYAFVLDNLMYAPSCRTKNDVYLGTTSPPTSKVCSNIPTTFCDPGILSGNTKYYWKVDARTPSGSASGPIWNFTTKCTAPPVINDIAFKECISGLCTAPIKVVASDPCGGTLTYTYTPLNGGTIIGSGPDVAFDPPSIAPGYPCPHKVEVTVTSSASGLSTSETIGIFVKIAGDINGDGLVNATDKLLLKNKLGWSGNPGAIPEDVNCDGYVNATDKLILRKTLGANWGCKCQYISSCEGKCCGEFTVCDPTGPCYCMKTTEGYGLCINSYSCSGLEDCKTSADCPSGKVCYECTCCGRNVCAPTTCIPGGPSGVSERAGGLTMTGQ
jgi:hypothetical protein